MIKYQFTLSYKRLSLFFFLLVMSFSTGYSQCPPVATASNNSPLCEGATLQLTANSVSGATYNWIGPNGFTSTLQNPVINNTTTLMTGNYIVTVSAGCSTTAQATTTATVYAYPGSPVLSNNSPVCEGDSLKLFASFVPGATYNWSGPNGFSSNVQNPVIYDVAFSNQGIYTATITVNGCTSAASSTTVVIKAKPQSPNATSNGPLCVGSTLNLTASTITGATYNWTGPNGFTSNLQNPVITNTALTHAGTYNVTATVNGCTSSAATTSVNINSIPTSLTIANNSPICVGATLNLSTTFVTGATYSWTGPNGFTSVVQNPVIQNTTLANGGVYNVTITVPGCGSIGGSTAVIINPFPATPTATNNGPLCTGSTLNLTATNIVGANYSWTGPNGFSSGLQDILIPNTTLVNAGTYNVTITVNGCTSPVASTTVIINPIPSAPAVTNNGPLCVGSVLSLTASTIAGATYSWTGPNGFTSSLQNPVITNTILADAGTYSVTATVNGCTSPAGTTSVIINSIPAAPAANNNGPLCAASTLNLTASTIAGATYSWTGPNGFISTIQNPVITNPGLADAGTYNVTVTVNGCTSPVAFTTVIIKPVPAAPTAVNNGPLCVGSSLSLSVTPVTGASYSWTGPNGFTSTLQNPFIANVTLADAGTYNVTATLNGCTGPAGSTAVTVNSIPAVITSSNNGPLCAGSPLNLTTSTVAGGTYSWAGPNGFTSSLQNPVITNTSLANAGTYNVTVTVPGCGSVAGTTSVIINPIPATPLVGNNGPLCVGFTLNLTAGTIAAANYSWTGPNGFTSSLQNPVITNTGLGNAGTYNVTATVNGCTGSAGSTNVIINPIPAAPAAGNNGPVCIGSALNLTASTITGATYSWTGPNGFTAAVQNPVITNSSLANAGTYNVTATVNGCTGIVGSTSVIINSVPAAPTANNNGPLCAGSTLNLTASTIAGASYSWTGPNGFTSSLQNPVITNTSLANTGTYNVTATVNGCTGSAGSTNVIVNPVPAPPTAGNNGPLCVGSALNLTAIAIMGATYSWTGPNGFTSSVQNPVITNTGLANAGTYNVTATLNGCTGIAGYTSVIINPIPAAPTANNNGPLCSGSTLNLTASTIAGASYSWTGPNGFSSTLQNPVITNAILTDAGTYNVTAIVNGCSNSPASTTVTIKPVPVTPTAGNNGPLCIGSALNLTATIITGAAYNWTGPNGFSSTVQNPVITNTTLANHGTYNVTATINGCTSSAASTAVTINDSAVSIAGTNQTVCADAISVNLAGTIIGGSTTGIWSTTGTGTFSPNNTSLNAMYVLTNTDKINGSVTLTLTSTNNGACPASVSFLVINILNAITVNAGADQSICASDNNINLNGQVTTSPGGIWSTTGSGTFSPSASSLIATYVPSAADKTSKIVLLILTSTGNGNCKAISDTLGLTINPGPSVNAGPDKFVLENTSATLEPVISGTNLIYLWSPGLYLNNNTIKNPIVTPFDDQLYTLRVTDTFGCFNQDEVMVYLLKGPKIPNTFTPNNDGINDTWIISNLEKYPGCRVQVFNRYGQVVFESKGYTKPWNGTKNGQSLPFGTYYYIIEPGNGQKPVTGYVTLIK